jgi:putative salt-induced outer membrane protein
VVRNRFKEQGMHRNGNFAAGLVAALALSTACADDAPAPPPPQGWSGKGQAGLVLSRGNTNADSANAKIDLGDLDGPWKQSLHLEGLYSTSNGITAAERWATLLQSNYQFDPRTFAFGALRYTDDEFSGFQYQGSATLGIGYHMLDSKSDQLTGQLGVGYRRLRPELIIKDADGAVIERIPEQSSGSAVGTAGLDYAHIFNASTKLSEKAQVEAGAGNTQLENDLALVVNMSKTLALSVGYTFIENTSPPAGLKKVDTLTTLNLVYSFNQ